MKVVMAAYEDSYDNELPISRLIHNAQREWYVTDVLRDIDSTAI